MRNLVLHFLVNVVAIAVVTSGLLPGIFIIGSVVPTIGALALVFGLVNSLIKPVVRALTCPFVLLSLGLFTFVIDGAMLYLAARLTERAVDLIHGGVVIENFAWAVAGALVASLISLTLEGLLMRGAPAREITIRVVPPEVPDDPDFDFYDPDTGQFK